MQFLGYSHIAENYFVQVKNSGDAVNWRQWETIPAVKANAFLSPDANKVYRMSSRVLDELTLLCAGIERYRAARN